MGIFKKLQEIYEYQFFTITFLLIFLSIFEIYKFKNDLLLFFNNFKFIRNGEKSLVQVLINKNLNEILKRKRS